MTLTDRLESLLSIARKGERPKNVPKDSDWTPMDLWDDVLIFADTITPSDLDFEICRAVWRVAFLIMSRGVQDRALVPYLDKWAALLAAHAHTPEQTQIATDASAQAKRYPETLSFVANIEAYSERNGIAQRRFIHHLNEKARVGRHLDHSKVEMKDPAVAAQMSEAEELHRNLIRGLR